MRTITVTEKYRAVNEGRMSKTEFVRQMRQSYPMYVSPVGTYDSTVQILKNKNMLFEEKEQEVDDTFKYSDDSLRRSIDIELEAMGLMSHGKISMEDQVKAKKKAIANLKKDPLHYYHLISGDSSKVDKHDKPVEVKKGNEVDTFNGMKKATLKEAKQNLKEGTRALVGYLSGDRLTTTYNHYDGYPSNLGKGLMTHYNDDEKAKEIAMKGYITGMDPDTGDISATHSDPPTKIKLPEEAYEIAKEIAEEIDSMGADYGYIWDDQLDKWATIKNTGIRSMIDQITDKLLNKPARDMDHAMQGINPDLYEKDIEEVDSSLDPYEDKKEIIRQVIELIKSSMPADNETIKSFIRTHYDDIINLGDDQAILDEFQEFLSVNTDYVDEKKVVEGDIPFYNSSAEEFPYLADYPVQQAFKKAGVDMGKPVMVTDVLMHGYDEEVDNHEMDATEAASYYEEERKKHIAQALKDYGKEWDDLSKTSTGVMPDYSFDEAGFDETPDGHDFKLVIEYGETTYVIISQKSGMSEKKGKDHDGDGDVDGDDYMHAKDKAIKKAMGKESKINEAVKNIITKVLEEEVLNEAATNDLAKIADEYGEFEGLKPAIIALQNIVTDIESFYDKTRSKIQKTYNDLGNVKNEEGLKVGAFIAPSIENAFKRDLKPIIKNQFHGGLDMPQVKRISQTDVDRGYIQQEAPKETVFTPVQENKKK